MLQAVATAAPTMMDALDFEAPWLIEKLQMECIVRSAAEAKALFAEVKRYIVLVRTDTSKVWEMHSLRVDAAWHQFVLYTFQYSEFCQRYFGRYIHHSPSNAPEVKGTSAKPVASFDMFKARYEDLFGQSLPKLWLDETSVCVDSRIGNQMAGKLTLSRNGEMVHLNSPVGQVLFSVNDIAEEALAFIARTGAFYVRELPGDLTHDERVALISELVRLRLLRAGG